MATMQQQRVTARSPVHGLSRRRLPFAAVLAQSTAAVAPAGVISVIPALVLQTSGSNLVLTFAIAAVVVVLIAFCLRPMAQRMATVSGLYSYIARGLGPVPALIGGWSALFGYALIGMTGLYAVGVYLTRGLTEIGLPEAVAPFVGVAVVVLAAGGMALAMVRGIRTASLVVLLVECVAIAILLGLMAAYLLFADIPSDLPRPEAPSDPGSLAVGVVLAIGGFVGFESATTLGGEARKPLSAIPRALVWTTIVGGGLYLLAVSFQEYVLRPQQRAGATGPLITLLSAQGTPLVALVIDLCIASSFLACAIASLNAFVRVLFCMGREGVMPASLGHAHERFRSPSVAILLTLPVIATVPVVLLIVGVPADTALTWLLLLSSFGYIGSYLLACVAMPLFLRRIGEDQPRQRWRAWITVIVVALVAAGATALHLKNEPELPLIYLAVIMCAVIHVILLKRRWPERLQAVGVYDETIHDDVLDLATHRQIDESGK